MRKNMELARTAAGDRPIVAAGTAMDMAVVVTPDELITVRAGLLGGRAGNVSRYRLGRLANMRVSRRSSTGGQCAGCWEHCAACIPQPIASCVQLEFGETPPAAIALIFGAEAQADFEHIVSVLGARLAASSSANAERPAWSSGLSNSRAP